MRDQTNNLWPPGGNCWKIKEVIILWRCETQFESCRNCGSTSRLEWQVFDICIVIFELFPFTTRFNIGICQVNEFFSAIMLWGQRIWQIKFWTHLCRWLFVYKKCKLACLFSLTPHSLIEGGIFWLGHKLLQWMAVLFVLSSFLILYEWLSNSKISLWQSDILVCTNAKCELLACLLLITN